MIETKTFTDSERLAAAVASILCGDARTALSILRGPA